MRKLFGIHTWKSGPRTVTEWREVVKGCKVKTQRPETPEEYHARKKDMVSILLFGKLFTMKKA